MKWKIAGILLFWVFLANCTPYTYPTMDPIPFQPVKYQGEMNDDAQVLFSSDGVYRIEVDIAEDLFDWDRTNGVDYTYLAEDKVSPAVFKFYWEEYGVTQPIVITGIGMKGRGGYYFETVYKKKYKISFPEGDDRFFGLGKINLNSNRDDSSLMREKLAYDMFNLAGVPSGRVAYTRLYMNGTYKGLYLLVEQVGTKFFNSRFDSPVGNCYKVNGSDLTWTPANREDYLPSTTTPTPKMQIKTNEDTFSHLDIVEFISILNNTPDDQFEQVIKQHFHVYEFLNALSLNILLGMIDDYWFYAHNFFLYNHHGKFMWIPWDMDHCFGAQWAFGPVENSNLFTFTPRSPGDNKRPLIDRILAVPAFYDYYRKCLKYHMETRFNEAFLFPKVDRLKALITASVLIDTYQGPMIGTVHVPLSQADFDNAFTKNFTWVHGIKPYITLRYTYAWPVVQDAY